MIERVQERFGVWPSRLAAGTAYGDGSNLAWLVDERSIEPHIPVFDKSARSNGTFARPTKNYVHRNATLQYLARKSIRTGSFATVPASTIATVAHFDSAARRIRQHVKSCARSMKAARDLARDLALTDAYVTARRQRKKVEMLFAHLKRILKLDCLRLRGLKGAHDEFLLAATAQNLRKMARLVSTRAAMAAR